MKVTIDTQDPRSVKAVAIAAGAGQWLKVRGHDGQKAYGIPSQRYRDVHHLVDCLACTCVDFQRRQAPCKHVLAVRLWVAVSRAHRPHRPRRGEDKSGRPAAA